MTGRITAILMILSLGISASISRAIPHVEPAETAVEEADTAVCEPGLYALEDWLDHPCDLGHPASENPGEGDSLPQSDGPWTPVIQQGVQDLSAGSARFIFSARHLQRLPGLLELPGRDNHRLGAWIEWLMAQARLESTNMSVVAPPLQPHAPPILL